jgi:hypothetical protein
MLMDAASIACRYKLLIAEIGRRMSASGKWAGLPGLLDELHSLRCQYQAAKASANQDRRDARLAAEPRAAVQ